MNKTIKIISVLAAGLTLALASASVGYVMHQPDTIQVPYEVEKLINVSVPYEVQVDNGNLDKVLDFVEYIDEDITLDYVLFAVDAEIEAEAYIHNNFLSLMKSDNLFDNNKVFEDYRPSEVSIKKIYEPQVVSYDYKDMEVVFSYEVKVKAKEAGEDSEYFTFNVTVPFEDAQLQEDDVELVLMD
jgi:hypothetical protein